MHELLIDLQLAWQIWRIIEANRDTALEPVKIEIREKCSTLLAKFDESENVDATALSAAMALPLAKLAGDSMAVVLDVLNFVSLACRFFALVKQSRSLTDEERNVGVVLSKLLEQANAIVPKHPG